MNTVRDWIMRASSSLRTDPTLRDHITFTEPQHGGGGCVINIDTDRIIAQFVLWPTWAYEASALSVESGETFHLESKPEADEQVLAEGWSRFMEAIRIAEARR